MSTRKWLWVIAFTFLAVGCGGDSGEAGSSVPMLAPTATPTPGFISDQHIVYSDGLHNENTEMMTLADRTLLVFRGGETGQTGSSRARIKIFVSTDNGQTFTLVNEVFMPNDPNDPNGGRDIRDPKLVQMGDTLFLYDISRLPGFAYRDLYGKAWTVRADSTDNGNTWTTPVKTYEPTGSNFWAFWRFTKRRYTVSGDT